MLSEVMIDNAPHITVAAMARRLGVSRKVAVALIRRHNIETRRLPFHAPGSRLYVPVADVERLLATH
jgi:excisionase family DNA binding protein